MTSGNKVFEGIKDRDKERQREGERESALPPRCARAWSSAAWEISFMRWKEKKGKGAGTDSTQLFSIKPFMASIKFSVSVWEVPLDCCCTPCSGLRGRRVFDSTTIQTGREQIRLVFSCQSPAFKLIEEDKKKTNVTEISNVSI